jgi:hypothetical protein
MNRAVSCVYQVSSYGLIFKGYLTHLRGVGVFKSKNILRVV